MLVNEFTDSNDKIGFLSSEPDVFSFLSLESVTQTVSKEDRNENYPTSYSWKIELGKNKREISRQVYTIFTLIGDFGGFNGAIIMFPAFFLSFYNSIMYNQAIEKELPVRKNKP